jgi:carbamate kinase
MSTGHEVVALEEYVILRAGEGKTFQDQMRNLDRTCAAMVPLPSQYDAMVIAHGNGPQVGNIVLQDELSHHDVPSMPLDASVTESQGLITCMVQLTLLNELAKGHDKVDVVSVLISMEIGANDEFVPVNKQIRLFYHRNEVDGTNREIEAVIDKDLISAMIVCDTGADTLIMLTDIDAVYIDYKTRSGRPLRMTDTSEPTGLLEQGQFPPGSIGPKVMAAIQLVNERGKKAVITNAANLNMALQGKEGTTVVRER